MVHEMKVKCIRQYQNNENVKSVSISFCNYVTQNKLLKTSVCFALLPNLQQ